MTVEVTPLTATLGAEVAGVDLRRPLAGDDLAAVRAAFTRHRLLFFRDQDLTAEQQLAFASAFGPPVVARGGDLALADAPAAAGASVFVTLEDGADSPPKADHWHTDVPFVAEPPDVAVLCMLDSPPVGGDTLWVDLHAVFDALSPTMQRMLSGLDQVVGVGAPVKAGYGGDEDGDREFRRLLDEVPPSRHPLVRAHPVTGRPALWWSGREFARGVAGMHPDESDVLLGLLQSRLDDPNHQCRWRWRAHDVAMWDERCTNHRAVSDHYPSFRAVRRCLVGKAAPRPGRRPAGPARRADQPVARTDQEGPRRAVHGWSTRETRPSCCTLPTSSDDLPGSRMLHKELSNVGAPGEELYGLSQAVRTGDTVYVSGQTASGPRPGSRHGSGVGAGPGDLADQMRQAYAKVAGVLAPFDAGLGNVVDEVLFVTDIDAAVRVAPAVRREAYGGRPAVASTLVEVRRLAAPDLLVEVKCTARIP